MLQEVSLFSIRIAYLHLSAVFVLKEGARSRFGIDRPRHYEPRKDGWGKPEDRAFRCLSKPPRRDSDISTSLRILSYDRVNELNVREIFLFFTALCK